MGLDVKPLNDDAEFENEAVDPGFSTDDSKIESSDEQLFAKKLKDMQIIDENNKNDAMNFGNDRKNGAFNPKNI